MTRTGMLHLREGNCEFGTSSTHMCLPLLLCSFRPSPGEYLKSLTSEWGFKNPHSVDNLKEMLGIPLGIRASCLDTVLVYVSLMNESVVVVVVQ